MEVFIEGMEEDLFDGCLMEVFLVEFSASFGMSDMDPIGCAIASTTEAVFFDKGFEEERPVGIAVLPIFGKALGQSGQDAGGKVL